jgi:hypothetical protein
MYASFIWFIGVLPKSSKNLSKPPGWQIRITWALFIDQLQGEILVGWPLRQELILIGLDHRNLVTRNSLPSGRRNARRDCKRLQQRTQSNLRHGDTSSETNGSERHSRVFVVPSTMPALPARSDITMVCA